MAQLEEEEYVELEEVIIHHRPRISGEEDEFIEQEHDEEIHQIEVHYYEWFKERVKRAVKLAIFGGLIFYGIVGGPMHQMRRNSTEHKLDPIEIHNIAANVYKEIHNLEEDDSSVRKLHSQMPEEEKYDETEYAFDPLQFEEEVQPPKVRRLLSDEYQQLS